MAWLNPDPSFRREKRLLLALAGILVVASCANPVPPRGGPEDTSPPAVIRSHPIRDTVNVPTSTQALVVEFSEYVERSSLSRSLSVTPTFERPLEFDWSGRSVEIEFPESLRDSTTYIFTFDTNLSDAHGVDLENPITVAFSTGPQINRGKIQGRVVSGRTGQPKKQVDVYAYALPPDAETVPRPVPNRPSYRTQTGENGEFAFDYMREQRYYVVALQDNNRNRQPDGLEPYAAPPRFALWADSTASPVPVPWLFTPVDSVAPELQRVRSSSRRRVRVSFNEPVVLETRAPSAWAPRDSATGDTAAVRSVYRDPEQSTDVVVRTARLDDSQYELALERSVVSDTAGLGLEPDTARFRAASRPDTMQTRFRGFLPANLPRDTVNARPLLPGVRPGVRFNQAPDSAALNRAVSVRDTAGNPRSFSLTTDDGTAYYVEMRPTLEPGDAIDVSVSGRELAGRDTTYERRFRRVTRRVLGELAGRVALSDTSGPVRPVDTTSVRPGSRRVGPTADPTEVAVELTASESSIPVEPRRLTTRPGSTFVFEELPEGQYQFRTYVDRNRNGEWDGGQLLPYVSPEPVTWLREPVEARPRWTTELPVPLRIPILVPGERGSSPSKSDTTRADSADHPRP